MLTSGHRGGRVAVVFGVLLATAAFRPCFGEAPAPTQSPADQGKLLYGIYCANCHGAGAKGDGPTAHLLKVKPSDLTRLSRNNADAFPSDRTYKIIDGREKVPGHGTGQMPIWGLGFQEWDKDVNQEAEVHVKILQLIEFLKTIQNED